MNALAAIAEFDSPGAEIRERRIDLGWTQAELSERSGVTQADISRIENGRLDARWSTLHRLSLALLTGGPPKRSLANGSRRGRATQEPTGPVWTAPTGVLKVAG